MLWRPWLHRDLREMVSCNFSSKNIFLRSKIFKCQIYGELLLVVFVCLNSKIFNSQKLIQIPEQWWVALCGVFLIYAVHPVNGKKAGLCGSASDAFWRIVDSPQPRRIPSSAQKKKLSDSDGEETDDSTASSAPHKQQIYVSSRFCPFEDCESQFLIIRIFHQVWPVKTDQFASPGQRGGRFLENFLDDEIKAGNHFHFSFWDKIEQ